MWICWNRQTRQKTCITFTNTTQQAWKAGNNVKLMDSIRAWYSTSKRHSQNINNIIILSQVLSHLTCVFRLSEWSEWSVVFSFLIFSHMHDQNTLFLRVSWTQSEMTHTHSPMPLRYPCLNHSITTMPPPPTDHCRDRQQFNTSRRDTRNIPTPHGIPKQGSGLIKIAQCLLNYCLAIVPTLITCNHCSYFLSQP